MVVRLKVSLEIWAESRLTAREQRWVDDVLAVSHATIQIMAVLTKRFIFFLYLTISIFPERQSRLTHFRGMLFHFQTHHPTPGHVLPPLSPSSAARTINT